MTSNLVVGQVAFYMTCPDGQVEISESYQVDVNTLANSLEPVLHEFLEDTNVLCDARGGSRETLHQTRLVLANILDGRIVILQKADN